VNVATAVRGEFGAEVTYLDTASMGLPPRRALTALQATIEQWRTGRSRAPAFDRDVEAARERYAALVGVPPSTVAVGSQVSVFAGLVAASLPDDAEVLVAEGEFTSVSFPFLAQARRGVRIREVPLDRLADEVTRRTSLVAVSAVQSADGRIADLDRLARATGDAGAEMLVDTTQATGWLSVPAGRFGYTVGGGYKWLLAPRGTCFFTVRPDLVAGLTPHTAGWYAGADPWTSIYGAPLRLAEDARRFDVSPAWHSWVAQARSLELLAEIGPADLHAHATGLAGRFRRAVGLPEGNSAIVSLAVDEQAAELLRAADVAVAVRAGRLRLAFHCNNTEQDADRAAEVLDGHVLG
jgi:selenocysteine lyase/cysteine desulfurase